MKQQMIEAVNVMNEKDDEITGYAIVVVRKSGGTSVAINANTVSMLGALEIAKAKVLRSAHESD